MPVWQYYYREAYHKAAAGELAGLSCLKYADATNQGFNKDLKLNTPSKAK